MPVDGQPSAEENAALARALQAYAKRTSSDDFTPLRAFLGRYRKSPWRAALLTNLGLEYYQTARYSRALEAWEEAWKIAQNATDPQGKAIGDRALGELAYMYARVGRMKELDALLKSVEGRVLRGPATERIAGAREGLWNMNHRPEIAFRCGPLALHRIKLTFDPQNHGTNIIMDSASTQQGFSLPQVRELSQKLGMNYQMARREKGAEFMMPAVVHWKIGHYAALIRKESGRYLLQDPTFGNDVWATEEALETETSGFYLVPAGDLPKGWRKADAKEAAEIWGKGNTSGPDPGPNGPCDPKSSGGGCGEEPCSGGGPNPGPNSPSPPNDDGGPGRGMAVPSVHLMLVSLSLVDEPVGYSPPVGPDVRFTVRYNQRDAFQPGSFAYPNFGPKWTCDWLSYIKDNPLSPYADVEHYLRGGGTRKYTGYNATTLSYAHEQYDQTKLVRLGLAKYELQSRDGSTLIFDQPDGTIGANRKVFLSKIVDPAGNALSLSYDANFRLVAISDAIGQVTTISYQQTGDPYKIARVTDPFGRFATFEYDSPGRLTKITDVIGLTSQFTYDGAGDFINTLITPYGTTSFSKGETGATRWLETLYPDGEKDRVEFNNSINIFGSDPPESVPKGMSTRNEFLQYRNTYYWGKIACAAGYGDYSKAMVYHWLHTPNVAVHSGALESFKMPLEGRVWYSFPGQSDPLIVGTSDQASRIGQVLDDGSTQLQQYEYNHFGLVTKSIDPVGRTFSYIYAANGIDLLEVRQTRAGNNELISKTTYDQRHLPLTVTDAAGQTTLYTYNARGQMLTRTDARGAVWTYQYDSNGYLSSVDGPLPGAGDTTSRTYDVAGRVRTETDESGYTVTHDYDALDRMTRTTYPDGTYREYTYNKLDRIQERDRAGRITLFEYNAVRQKTKTTDPLNRSTRYQWCKCGDIKSITDPMGRITTWRHDVQGRQVAKIFADGSQISYQFEPASGRLARRIDEKGQITEYTYYLDNKLKSQSYPNAIIPTPGVSFTYDLDYPRVASMTDGTGITRYAYHPITNAPLLGAGRTKSEDGPLANDTVAYEYNEIGEVVTTSINGVTSTRSTDLSGRVISEANVLGTFSYSYQGHTHRPTLMSYPNGLVTELAYGSNIQDFRLQRITNKIGATIISEFLTSWDVPRRRIVSWSQQSGPAAPKLQVLGYDAVDQLLNVTVTQSGNPIQTYVYNYDPASNRVTETVGGVPRHASYNALNQLTSNSATLNSSETYEWDAEHRLRAVNQGNRRTEFDYDGLSRRVQTRSFLNGAQVSHRHFVWKGNEICEERDNSNQVVKRFLPQGFRMELGPILGMYYYSKDHLSSIRELIDASGAVRARYEYDAYGGGGQIEGDVTGDFGFATMMRYADLDLYFTKYRAYDPELGRWLSRDSLARAELLEGPNLYCYVGNNPINKVDLLGLSDCDASNRCLEQRMELADAEYAYAHSWLCDFRRWFGGCEKQIERIRKAKEALDKCLEQFEDE